MPHVLNRRRFLGRALAVGSSLALAHPGGGPPSLTRPATLVGPEGGWSDDELASSLPRVGLGPSVLRAETAAFAAGLLMCALRARIVAPLPGG